MLATRWQPLFEMDRLSREMDRMFGKNGSGAVGVGTFPALNIWEDRDNLYAEAELPGFSLNDLEISLTGSQLTIKGERRPPEDGNGTWHRQERAFGKFTRMIELPGEVNGASVSAVFANGVLNVTLPKSEAVKPRRIEVKVR